MRALPRVGHVTRGMIALEFDDRGPDVCRAQITADLEAHNPSLLLEFRGAKDSGYAARVDPD
jgi:hypothetical protein